MYQAVLKCLEALQQRSGSGFERKTTQSRSGSGFERKTTQKRFRKKDDSKRGIRRGDAKRRGKDNGRRGIHRRSEPNHRAPHQADNAQEGRGTRSKRCLTRWIHTVAPLAQSLVVFENERKEGEKEQETRKCLVQNRMY